MRDKPKRVMYLFPRPVRRVLVASDAAEEEGKGSGGFLVVVYDGEKQWRMGVVVPIHASIYRFWNTEQERFIAQLELLMVVVALWHLAPLLQGSIITWYIDNTAALMSLIKGRSNHDDLDSMSGVVHAMLYALQAQMWSEWIESSANWSDQISRQGSRATWHVQHGFSTVTMEVAEWVLSMPPKAVIAIMNFRQQSVLGW